ncbi:hypothetical protein SGCOL_009538 [Colletotrichum sp. CLE4]
MSVDTAAVGPVTDRRPSTTMSEGDAAAFLQQQQQQQHPDAVTGPAVYDSGPGGGDVGTSSTTNLREDQHMHHQRSTSPADSRHHNDGDEHWSCSPDEDDDGPAGRPASWPGSTSQPDSPGGQSTRSLKSSGDIEGHITSSDLLNPSDALNLLAQVADLDGEERRDDMRHLYIDHFHPFFPVADKCILTHTPATVASLIDSEPHLVTAIFTVASKDEPSMSRVHEACSRYMETLISKLIYKGSTAVGAVEALLILAQWAPQRLQEKPTIGRGEEDEGAWMQIGVAIRLGYLQSLEQTGLLSDKTSPSSETFRRKRLVWAGLNLSYEFLRLYINAFAFQATINRAITKARQQQQQHIQQNQQYQQSQQNKFSKDQTQQYNGHETTTGSHAPARHPPPPPPTATISPLFADLASTPDARFIYESMDAANSLLNILNSSVDPATGLRYMPLKYYLYVIYAAVFLFKVQTATQSMPPTVACRVQRSVSTTEQVLGLSRCMYRLYRVRPTPITMVMEVLAADTPSIITKASECRMATRTLTWLPSRISLTFSSEASRGEI